MSDLSPKIFPIQQYPPMTKANQPSLWPEKFFHGYNGRYRGHAGPNGVVGPWILPAGFSYTGEVVVGPTRAKNGGQWLISWSGHFGPYHPVLMAPVGVDHYRHLKRRQQVEGHKMGLAGPGDGPKVECYVLEHENTATSVGWLSSRIKMAQAKLRS